MLLYLPQQQASSRLPSTTPHQLTLLLFFAPLTPDFFHFPPAAADSAGQVRRSCRQAGCICPDFGYQLCQLAFRSTAQVVNSYISSNLFKFHRRPFFIPTGCQAAADRHHVAISGGAAALRWQQQALLNSVFYFYFFLFYLLFINSQQIAGHWLARVRLSVRLLHLHNWLGQAFSSSGSGRQASQPARRPGQHQPAAGNRLNNRLGQFGSDLTPSSSHCATGSATA